MTTARRNDLAAKGSRRLERVYGPEWDEEVLEL